MFSDAVLIANRDSNPAPGPLSNLCSHKESQNDAELFASDHQLANRLAEVFSRPDTATEKLGPVAFWIEVIEWLEDKGVIPKARRAFTIDDETPKLLSKTVDLWRIIKKSPDALTVFCTLHCLGDPLADAINGNMDMSQAARAYDVRKATVNKRVKQIQAELHYPPRLDQRQKVACQKMEVSRRKQIGKKKQTP
jgi:hypothetical protein